MFYQTNINHMQATERAEKCRFCPWWPWPLTSDLQTSKRGTKHVFFVNLTQIRSAVPEIFHRQTKKTEIDGAKNRTCCSSLRAVETDERMQKIGSTSWKDLCAFASDGILAWLGTLCSGAVIQHPGPRIYLVLRVLIVLLSNSVTSNFSRMSFLWANKLTDWLLSPDVRC